MQSLPGVVVTLFLTLAALAGNGAVANVLAIETAFPVNRSCQLVGLLLRSIDAGTHGSGAQHPTTGRHYLTILERGASVENLAFQCGGCIQALDGCAFGVVTRIAAGGQDDADART